MLDTKVYARAFLLTGPEVCLAFRKEFSDI